VLSLGLCASDAGGFVDDRHVHFERAAGLDPLVHWLLHVGRAALTDAGLNQTELPARAGAILGNLAYPTQSLVDLAQSLYLPERPAPTNPLNRFSAGLPVHFLCNELGLSAGGYAIDAACASSLYAIKIACDWLQSGRADLMLAGAVNRVEGLLIHAGFTALRALSPTGRSRPFHREADGLVPAEGAAILVLKRLSDAEKAGDRILGVIRGIGLSNDGRGSGLLTPSVSGQVRAMHEAYVQSGLTPADISLVECHATGTAVGDAVELQSMSQIFAGCRDVPIGSLKSNLGHLITASGAAGIIKLLEALKWDTRPATLNSAPATKELEVTPFRLLTASEPWNRCDDVPRRAAISSFGFGGNNAHLILEEFRPGRLPLVATMNKSRPIAVIGFAARAGSGTCTEEFEADLIQGATRVGRLDDGEIGAAAEYVRLPGSGIVFPPKDLERSLAQQNLLLELTVEAAGQVGGFPAERTSAFVGMTCDPEAARTVLQAALPDLLDGTDVAARELSHRQDAMDAGFDAARVVGCMPNIPANRLNRQFDLLGPSFTVAAEELSGIRALELASQALASNEVDVTIAAAVDFSVEPVHRLASGELPGSKQVPGDGGCVLILKRLEDAIRAEDTIRAILDMAGDGHFEFDDRIPDRVRHCFGHVHAASGLLDVAAAVVSLDRRVNFCQDPVQPILPNSHVQNIGVQVDSLGNLRQTLGVIQHQRAVASSLGIVPDALPEIYTYSARDVHALLVKLRSDDRKPEHNSDPCRMAVVATADTLHHRLKYACSLLEQSRDGFADTAFSEDGIFYHAKPVAGDLAFVFTGASAAYAGMGRELLLAFPDLVPPDSQAQWAYGDAAYSPNDFELLCGSSLLCQVHARFSQEILNLQPQAAIGLSSGETNSLYAFGAWQRMQDLLRDIEDCGLYTSVLGGNGKWASYWIAAPADQVSAALASEPSVQLTIINSPEDVVIAGESQACRRVFDRLGQRGALLGGDFIVHCAAVQPAADLWWRLHHRATRQPEGVRFYSNALGRSYELTADAVADALTQQAVHTVDFPRTIRRAWDDGVRIFVEHGPRSQCTQSIRRILQGLPHLSISLDVPSRSSLSHALYTAAELWTAGIAVDLPNLRRRLDERQNSRQIREKDVLRLPAHPLRPDVVVMTPAPSLAPVSRDKFETPSQAQSNNAVAAAVALHAEISKVHQEHLQQLVRMDVAFQQTQARILQTLSGRAVSRPIASRRAFSRPELEIHASGKISEIFGPSFQVQDQFVRQVRMPEPPLLLADRVVELTGEPGSMGLGSITTETDVRADSWYLHCGRMPAGITIESGQADLMLISWLGVDKINKGNRVYRLLGCDLAFSGGLPRIGETLHYEIHVDSHAAHAGVRMFFFHYDCTSNGVPRLTVRNGQAGFFTDDELANSEGVLWAAEGGAHTPTGKARMEQTSAATLFRSFDIEQIRAFAAGRIADCFGPEFEKSFTHSRTPCIQGERMQLLQTVPIFDPQGGPWQRGYLRAEWRIDPEDWFFSGHFKNDPCMPGTLMFEGCLQAMAFYLTASGFTLEHDGWRFEPVPDQFYSLRCRGQVLPTSRLLAYEIFVDEIVASPVPTLYADVLCTVDGLKAFHCARLGLQLVPDWPLDELEPHRSVNVPYDYQSLMACALGRPSNAFGSEFAKFDGPIRVPRLPGPPYHFMSRVVRTDGPAALVGASIEVEYDVPKDAWYFAENGYPVMPVSVLTEVLLQPCGWLASYAGTWKHVRDDIFFRNLDGSGTFHSEVGPDDSCLRTRVTLKSCSEVGPMSITSFDISCHSGSRLIFDGRAVFGHFPADSLRNQAGLAASEDELKWIGESGHLQVDLDNLTRSVRIGQDKLRMINRITGYWPAGGAAKLGRIRAEFDVDARQWFFKAHFFGDPVQPGSLGMEAIAQTLQVFMLADNEHFHLRRPRFEPIASAEPIAWTYRGQVLPNNRTVTILAEIVEKTADMVRASASLWVDGMKIYSVPQIAMRVVERAEGYDQVEVLDPQVDSWLEDHCPTYTIPVLPMMSIVDRLAAAAHRTVPSKRVTELRDVTLNGWISFAQGKRKLKTEVSLHSEDHVNVALSVWRDAPHAALSRFDVMATAVVELANHFPPLPPPFEPLSAAAPIVVPYDSGELFHGPGFHFVQRIARSVSGSSFDLDSKKGHVPRGFLNQGLFDGITHGIPNENLHYWSERIPQDQVGYPSRITRFAFFGDPPQDGVSHCEMRFAGFQGGDARFPQFRGQLIKDGQVWAELDLVYVLFAKGPLGIAPAEQRRDFLQYRKYASDMLLGRIEGGATVVSRGDLYESDWLPGTIDRAFALTSTDRVRELAIKQHVARLVQTHPSKVVVLENGECAPIPELPLNRFSLQLERLGETVRVCSDPDQRLDCAAVRAFWKQFYGIQEWPIADLHPGLIERFIRRVELVDPAGFEKTRGKPALFLANHQVAIESILFGVVVSALSDLPIKVIAKAEHRHSWIGQLIQLTLEYPEARQERPILFFDRTNPAAMLDALRAYYESLKTSPSSLMVHVEGTRALSCRTPVTQVSSVFLDLAVEHDLPIVPVRFVGGLPAQPVEQRLEFPFGGQQDIRIGSPIFPGDLRPLSLIDRTKLIVSAINGLAPDNEDAFGLHSGDLPVGTVLKESLRSCKSKCAETEMLIAALQGHEVHWPQGRVGAWLREFADWLREITAN
jgi:acyl transferase domain-containing protein/3-hydroxymyristoyl/3-hydroxydecanoyl-(acyl carrier protein) dehydratase/1-acyl-sn-glycerol-3-phosphate acyltransferase